MTDRITFSVDVEDRASAMSRLERALMGAGFVRAAKGPEPAKRPTLRLLVTSPKEQDRDRIA